MSDLNLTIEEGGDIYLSIAETPAVVTLSQPVISGAISSTVTVSNTVTVAQNYKNEVIENDAPFIKITFSSFINPPIPNQSIYLRRFPKPKNLGNNIIINPSYYDESKGFYIDIVNPNPNPDDNAVGLYLWDGASLTPLAYNHLTIQEYDSKINDPWYWPSNGWKYFDGDDSCADNLKIEVLNPHTQAVSGAVTISNFPSAQVVTGTVALDAASLASLESITVTVGNVTIGSSVSISNLPSVQAVSGTVTANTGFTQPLTDTQLRASAVPVSLTSVPTHGVTLASLPASTVTVSNFPNTQSISGTVTANISGTVPVSGTFWQSTQPVSLTSTTVTVSSLPSIPAGTAQIGSVTANISGTVPVSISSVTIGAMPNGTLTTRFGTPATASTAFLTTAVTNTSRKYLLIQNVTTASNVITVGIGFTPTTTQGIQLAAGAGITFESSYIPTGAVWVLSSVTASNFTILEA